MSTVWETPRGVKLRHPTSDGGYFRLDYRLGGRRRQPSVGRNLDAAWQEACRADQLLAVEHGDLQELPVAAMVDAWTDAHKDVWSARYKQQNKETVERFLQPHIGGMPVGELTRSAVKETIFAGNTRAVRRITRTAVSSLLSWAASEGWLQKDPTLLMPTREKGTKPSRVLFVPLDETPELADVLALTSAVTACRLPTSKYGTVYAPPQEYAYMVLVAAFCGLRQGELFGLQGKHISGGNITVARQIQEVDGKLVVCPPKTGKGRTVVIPSTVGGYQLKQWLEQQAKKVGSDGLIFAAPRGGVWRKSGFGKRVFRPARQQVWTGKPWSFHSLRHFYCRWLLNQGVEPKDVSLMAGHASVKTTLDLYISNNASALERVAEKIG